MQELYNKILYHISESKKEFSICLFLIALTYITLYWTGNTPSVALCCEPGGSYLNSTSKDLYICSIDFSKSDWHKKYKMFDCYLMIGDKEFYLLKESVSGNIKEFAFGIDCNVKKELCSGTYKCKLVIKPSETDNYDKDSILQSNELKLEF